MDTSHFPDRPRGPHGRRHPVYRRASTPPARRDHRPESSPPGDATPAEFCRHDRRRVGRFDAEICTGGEVEWWEDGEVVDPALAMAAVFGGFELRTVVDALGAPGPAVFVYGPDGRRGRQALRQLPPERWIEAAPDLWIGRDEDHLLMCPSDPVLAANLRRRL